MSTKIHKHEYGIQGRPDGFFDSIEECIQYRLDGAEYGQGELEEIKATQRKVISYLGKLTQLLHDGNVITEQTIDETTEYL